MFFLGTWKIDSKIYIKEQSAKNNQDAPQEDKYVWGKSGKEFVITKLFMKL